MGDEAGVTLWTREEFILIDQTDVTVSFRTHVGEKCPC